MLAIGEYQVAAVRLGDLPAKYQSDAGSSRFGGKEGYEEVLGIGQSGSFVADRDFERLVDFSPTDLNRAVGLERRLDRVLDQDRKSVV